MSILSVSFYFQTSSKEERRIGRHAKGILQHATNETVIRREEREEPG